MDISLVTIYEDNLDKIEMIKSIADWLWMKKATRYHLSLDESEMVSNEAIRIAIMGRPKKQITTTDIIPVISKEIPIFQLIEPYHIFEEAMLLIGDAFGNLDVPITDIWRDRVSSLVTNYYDLQGMGRCLCAFFPEPIYKVDGFLFYYNEDNETENSILLPFIINDGKFKRLY